MAMAFAGVAALIDWLLRGRPQVSARHPGAGWLIGAAGSVIMLRGWWLFKEARVAISPTAETVRLVTHGIYRVTRNPMYLGLALMMVGLAVGIGTASFYIAALAWFVVINSVFCRYEEAKLAARFGAEYLEYTRRVRRWL
jgi:protein-S-isoprenylcysteine O-methyltransferase Ste14